MTKPTHYKPSQKPYYCGDLQPQWNPKTLVYTWPRSTTIVDRVTCLACRKRLKKVVDSW